MEITIPQFQVLMSPKAGEKVQKVLDSGYIGQGEKVEEFEAKLRAYLDSPYVVTVNSCTSAIWLALHLIGVKSGDKVISTPMTCSATNEVIYLMGADIIWADVDEYGNISPIDVKSKMSHDVKAVVAVDWGGVPCDYDSLREVVGETPIVEDAAHAFGASYKSKYIARDAADYKCFSFQAIKHLTTGDGGALITPPEQYERARLLRWYGFDRENSNAMRCRQDLPEPGFKFHMNDINAAIGLANIHEAVDSLYFYHINARTYYNEFKDLGIIPPWPEDSVPSWWLYTIHVNNPIGFEKFMADRGIGASQTHSRNDKFTFLSKYATYLPNLDQWFSTMCCIPVGWWLTQHDLKQIIDSVKIWVNGE